MSRRLEIAALLGLCFFLPLYEAPKSIFWVLYALIWIVNRVRARDFGGRWDAWDSVFAAWIASGFVVAAFAGLAGGDEWRGAVDLLRYGSIGWMVKRSRLDDVELRRVLGTLVLSALVGLVGAFISIFDTGAYAAIRLNSVGHENHTAIYLAMVLGVCVAWVFAAWRRWGLAARGGALVATLVVVVALVLTASRSALVFAGFVPLVLAIGWLPRWRAPLVAAVIAMVIGAGVVFVARPYALQKHFENVDTSNVFAYRDRVWSVALAAFRQYPWFGVGMDNYHRINHERGEAWGIAPVEKDMRPYTYAPHAHSLYFNTLAERGALGFAALAAVLIAWGARLLRRPSAEADELAWLLWGAAAAAWIVSLGVGLVNTTLHHEHGILAALLLALWLAKRPATPG